MSQSISLWGANYTQVPGIDLPKTGGGTAYFADPSVVTAGVSDVAVGKYFIDSSGALQEGTGTGGGGVLDTVTILEQQTLTATTAESAGYCMWLDNIISEPLEDDANYMVTMDGDIYLCHANSIYGNGDKYAGDLNVVWGTPANAIYPFAVGSYATDRSQWFVPNNSAHTVKIEKVTSYLPSDGGYTLTNIIPTQTINCNISIGNYAKGGYVLNATPLDDSKQYLITYDGVKYVSECGSPQTGWLAIGEWRIESTAEYLAMPCFVARKDDGTYYYLSVKNSNAGEHTLRVDELTFVNNGVELGTKSITANGTYNAYSDGLDAYTSVTVSVSGGSSTLITKSISSNGTYNASSDNADGYSQVTVSVPNSYSAGDEGKVVSSGALVSQTAHAQITSNGTYDTTTNNSVTVAVSGSSKNVQTNQSTTRRSNTSLGSINSLTCKTTGTYDVYWTCARSNTSQTWGSQLYIGGSAYGTENTTWSNNVQNNHLTNVSISKDATVAVYGRSRSGYYIYAPQLTIVQN